MSNFTASANERMHEASDSKFDKTSVRTPYSATDTRMMLDTPPAPSTSLNDILLGGIQHKNLKLPGMVGSLGIPFSPASSVERLVASSIDQERMEYSANVDLNDTRSTLCPLVAAMLAYSNDQERTDFFANTDIHIGIAILHLPNQRGTKLQIYKKLCELFEMYAHALEGNTNFHPDSPDDLDEDSFEDLLWEDFSLEWNPEFFESIERIMSDYDSNFVVHTVGPEEEPDEIIINPLAPRDHRFRLSRRSIRFIHTYCIRSGQEYRYRSLAAHKAEHRRGGVFRFMDLPLELRNLIEEQCLIAHEMWIEGSRTSGTVRVAHKASNEWPAFHSSEKTINLTSKRALFWVNHAIRQEAIRIYYAHNQPFIGIFKPTFSFESLHLRAGVAELFSFLEKIGPLGCTAIRKLNFGTDYPHQVDDVTVMIKEILLQKCTRLEAVEFFVDQDLFTENANEPVPTSSDKLGMEVTVTISMVEGRRE